MRSALVRGGLRGSWAQVAYPYVAIVRGTEEDFLASFADVDAIDDLLVAWMPPDALSSLDVPAGEVHVGRGGKDDAGVARPLQVQDSALVPGEDAVVLAIARGAPKDYPGLSVSE